VFRWLCIVLICAEGLGLKVRSVCVAVWCADEVGSWVLYAFKPQWWFQSYYPG
jgi:hypothetical protein